MVRPSQLLIYLLAFFLFGCGIFNDNSYNEDLENDRKIINDIIEANPILQSARDSGYSFLQSDSETNRITAWLHLGGLNLNDSNFNFSKNISNLRLVKYLDIADNNFTDLPGGTRNKNWEKVDVWKNKICNPPLETINYLDKKSEGSLGGYWRNTQRCADTVPEFSS